MRKQIGLVALAALAATGGLLSVSSPARADDDYYHRSDRYRVRRDVADLHADQRRLRELDCRRDELAYRHDWHAERVVDRRIDHERREVARDRAELHHDVRRAREDRRY